MTAGRGLTTERRRHAALDTGHRRPAREDLPRTSVRCHREDVVRRLLARGLSPTTLMALLPDFRPVVQRVMRRG